MSDPHDERPRRGLRIFEERTERRGDATGDGAGEENPYWSAFEEAEPHPDPARGCIRRGLCCKSSPGWFAPGEVEGAAALLGMRPDDFVRRFVVIDTIELDGEAVEVFVPAKRGRDGAALITPGTRADRLYRMLRSPCIFFDEEARGCAIYAARPLECQRYICTNEPSQNLSHQALARMWRDGVAPDDEPR